MTLYIRARTEIMEQLIQKQIQNHRFTDSGFDIPIPATNVDLNIPQHSFNLEISVAAMMSSLSENESTGAFYESDTPAPCLLLPRSSIYKFPLRLTNSIGLIDAGYRGEVQAKVDILEWKDKVEPEYLRFDCETRLFQICQHNFLPWKKIVLVKELPAGPDDRGVGGFGSTGS